MRRRTFVAQLSAFGLALAGIPRVPVWRRPRFVADPFSLGVASGDPGPDGVVLWTRLAPDPANGGGMSPESVKVRWEVASDEAMTQIVRRGSTMARPDLAHSVHAEVGGLRPDRWYWFRFDAGGEASMVGRTRTAPAPGTAPDRLRLGFVSCQHYEQGLYTAHRHLADEELDLVLCLGDYIYEHGVAPNAPPEAAVRRHGTDEPRTLDEYRARYALYKQDENLQAAHRNVPWIVTWDDHEVSNNYAGLVSADSESTAQFRLRRAAAYQAYYEHQPLRKAAIPRGPDALLYRTLDFGALARFHVLDTRQYRSDQSCGDGIRPPCAEWSDPHRTMMGDVQERWLHQRVDRSTSAWNVLAQQVAFMPIGDPRRPEAVAMDPWSGYPAARDRLIGYMAERQEKNFVVLSGDIHSSFVMDVKRDVADAASPTVATEFIGTSISSAGDGRDRWPQLANYEHDVPTMRYHSARRGYVRCDVTATSWTSDYRLVPYVSRPGAPVQTDGSFVVRRGRPGVERSA